MSLLPSNLLRPEAALAVFFSVLAGGLMAEQKTEPVKRRPGPVVSPVFEPDGGILFQLKAPKAE